MIEYMVKYPKSEDRVITPTYTQKIPECAKRCVLYENLYPWDIGNDKSIVTAFNDITGEITINTNDKTLDDSFNLFSLQCNSTEAKAAAIVDFEIHVKDFCRTLNLTPPSVSPNLITTELFKRLDSTIEPATIIGDYQECGTFYY